MKFLANKRWSLMALASAILAMLAIGTGQHYVFQNVELHIKHSRAVAEGTPTASLEEIERRSEQLLSQAVLVGRTGVVLWAVGAACLGRSLVRNERGFFQQATVVVLILTGLLALMIV